MYLASVIFFLNLTFIIPITLIMKNNYLILFALLFIYSHAFAQEFSFVLFIQDNVGNIDSLTLGYDINATDTIDSFFDEVNIIGSPYKPELDMRSSNHFFGTWNDETSFESKKQFIRKNCPFSWIDLPLIEVDIKSTSWPLKVYWNKNLFNQPCDSGSVLTSVSPGGWWDTSGEIIMVADYDSAILNQSSYRYISGTDTLNEYWIAFGDESIIATGIDEITSSSHNVLLFPNPANDLLQIAIPLDFGKSASIQVVSNNGMVSNMALSGSSLDITSLPTGLYHLILSNTKGQKIFGRFERMH